MAEPLLSSSVGTAGAADPQMSLEQRRQRLVDTLLKKIEQGYEVESQSDTDAILVTKGRPKRWFGLVEGGSPTRQSISIDGKGSASMRSL
jgi:hypothetical protein